MRTAETSFLIVLSKLRSIEARSAVVGKFLVPTDPDLLTGLLSPSEPPEDTGERPLVSG